jgi:hypothetical protein
MEPIIKAYRSSPNPMVLEPLPVTRDWMDATPDKHAYHCFPVTLANTVGWSLSCPKDVTFIWDGINDTTNTHIKFLEGEEFVWAGRGQSTVSFNTNLIMKTTKDLSILTISVPNYFHEDFDVMNSVMSTSFYPHPLPLAIKVKTPNKKITIKAGTPIAAIIPISLTNLKDSYIEIDDYASTPEEQESYKAYGDAASKLTSVGQWTDWYRNAINEKGESVGEHEVKALKLKTIYLKEGKPCGINN